MNKEGYNEILLRYLYPWMLRTYGGRCFVHQDNDPKHKSRLCMQTCFRFGINVVSVPKKIYISFGKTVLTQFIKVLTPLFKLFCKTFIY
jgi:hypothetical protein